MRILFGVAVLLGLLGGWGRAAEFRIDSIQVGAGGGVEVGYPSEAGFYYRVMGGSDVGDLSTPVSLTFGGVVNLSGDVVGSGAFFLRVEKWPATAEEDTDGDGIPDAYELFRSATLNGLDPFDAQLDLDGDGRSALEEYEASRGLGLTMVMATSPFSGEAGVAVTRETEVAFTAPLSGDSVLTTGGFYAEFGGRKLLSRVELSSDRRKATLFYLENLPGGARVRVTFDGEGLLDWRGAALDADGDGVAGGLLAWDFDTASQTPLAGTVVAGRVFASELLSLSGGSTNLSLNVPLSGVVVTADGLEESVRAVTDEFGNFRLTNAPAGDFFVHIDGRLVRDDALGVRYPDLAYYPFVGKLWTSLPGGETNVGSIYLPLVSAGTLRPVSQVEATTVVFPDSVLEEHPELEGVSITVPANSLFSDSGLRGGRVGIAPVPPDRLPGPLPEGLRFPLVITVQTDGASNFDQPVPACFPNLPDPETGEILPPGAKSALWSFNHDTGFFEIVGPMTVSADGRLVCTDPGVGIPAPGWHGTAPGSSGGGGGGGGGPGPNPPEGPGKNPALEDCGGGGGDPVNDSNPVSLFSGEKVEQAIDLRIRGVGMDFVWARTYGSRSGANTAQGNGWDFSYNLQLLPSGSAMEFSNGAYRRDVYVRQAGEGSGGAVVYGRRGFAHRIEASEQGGPTMTLADGRALSFHAQDGSALQGKLELMVDRNGNAMSFSYDGAGRLVLVVDTLGREISIAYNADGFIDSVTDFAGRSVRYRYYGRDEAGGSFGDLKSVTLPSVVGTPNANDFPQGKTTTYTYSTGFADERLNHNLLTITDARRNDPSDSTFGDGPYLVNVYSSATNPRDPSFDRVIRQVRGGDPMHFTYVPLLQPSVSGAYQGTVIRVAGGSSSGGGGGGGGVMILPDPQVASGVGAGSSGPVLKVILNDRMGNVSEHFYDAGNRLLSVREFTGRANPSLPVTESANRPLNKLRSEDPEYFETLREYNSDSLLSRVIYPAGNSVERVYEGDLNASEPVRSRGNLRLLRRLPGPLADVSDQSVIEEEFEYATDFGCGACGFNFVTLHRDGRGYETRSEYDERGNLLRRVHPVAGVEEGYEYNERGQLSRHVLPEDANGYRRVDDYHYYGAGAQSGFLRLKVVDVGGLGLETSYEYDTVGNIVRQTDSKGNDVRYVVNALDQVVRVTSRDAGEGVRYVRDYAFDANNNLVRVDVRNLDEAGVVAANEWLSTVYEYEVLNYLVREEREVEEGRVVGVEYGYDARRNLILKRFGEGVAGRQAGAEVRGDYDERNRLYREIRGPGLPEQSTTLFDYTLNARLTRVQQGIEAGASETLWEYDGYDRVVVQVDAMGNGVFRNYDAGGNIVREVVEGELEDIAGSEDNVRLSEVLWEHDGLGRETVRRVKHFDAATGESVGDGESLRRREYRGLSQLTKEVDDYGGEVLYGYDSLGRRTEVVDAMGNRTEFSFDENSNLIGRRSVEKHGLGLADEVFEWVYAYDGLDRRVAVTDGVGNVRRFEYDSRDNRVVEMDGRGNRTRYRYDGLNRLVETRHVLTGSGTGSGVVVGEVVKGQGWDDSGRVVSRTDGNGNTTRYEYDALSRLAREERADGSETVFRYDAHDDRVGVVDANGSVQELDYDGVHRLVSRGVVPGAGVSSGATFERFEYDGLSRLVYAEDDDSVVVRAYDSLSRTTLDSVNGREAGAVYDGMGRMVLCVYPSGLQVTYGRDLLGRVNRVGDEVGELAVYSYSGDRERIVRRDLRNGTRLEQQFNGMVGAVQAAGDFGVGLVSRTVHSKLGNGQVLDAYTYGYDPDYNNVQRNRMTSGDHREFDFDSMSRLVGSVSVSAGGGAETIAYELDAAGNRIAVEGGEGAGEYGLGVVGGAGVELNQYATTPGERRSYDANGNLVLVERDAGGRVEYDYDFRNQLVGVSDSGTGRGATYGYDALGRRISRTVLGGAGTRIDYVLLGSQELEERQGGGALLARYIYGAGDAELLWVERGGQEYFYHTDKMGSVVAVTDDAGVVVERYSYGDYGYPKILAPGGGVRAVSAIQNEVLFAGRRFDPETGLYFHGARFMDPRVGRFISRDPAGGWFDGRNHGNAFAYAGNNPVSLSDPSGLLSESQCDVIREMLEYEREHGTPDTAAHFSNTGGKHPMGDDFDNQPIETDYGTMDLDWWTDLRGGGLKLGGTSLYAAEGATVEILYYYAKLGWNALRGHGADPYEDEKEYMAVEAIDNGAIHYSDLFPPDFMKNKCKEKEEEKEEEEEGESSTEEGGDAGEEVCRE